MPSRRYLTFSLRAFFVLLTAFAIWLGVVVNRAREQREAVKAIEALGGNVRYDWEQTRLTPLGKGRSLITVEPYGPGWLRDFYQEAVCVEFNHVSISDSDIRAGLPYLKRLPELKVLGIGRSISKGLRGDLKSAIPKCDLSTPLQPASSP